MVRAEMSSLHGFDNIPKLLPSEHGRIIQQFLFSLGRYSTGNRLAGGFDGQFYVLYLFFLSPEKPDTARQVQTRRLRKHRKGREHWCTIVLRSYFLVVCIHKKYASMPKIRTHFFSMSQTLQV
jgi:hypothetical protein